MILAIFLIILGISLIFIVSASAFNSPVLGIIGYTFLFLCGVAILNEGVYYTNGVNVTMADETLASSSYVSAPILQSWEASESHLYGYLLAIAGAFGFVLVLFDLKGEFFKPPGSQKYGGPFK